MANKVELRMKVNVRKNDTVMVLSGKDKDKRGKVVKVLPAEGKVVVEGVNVVKKHSKPKPPKVPQGGILEKAMPIDSSKVMLVCDKCDKPVRVKKSVSSEGVRIRVCRKCGEQIKASY